MCNFSMKVVTKCKNRNTVQKSRGGRGDNIFLVGELVLKGGLAKFVKQETLTVERLLNLRGLKSF